MYPLLVLALLAGASAPPDSVVARLQAALDSFRIAAGVPGVTFGVAFPDGSTAGLASGLSDTAARRPMRPSDRMLQGSVGKTYVAAVALQLVAEGRLALDAPISRYLGSEPWFPRLPNGAAITVRQLMNHTSGLVRYEFDPAATRILREQPFKTWTPEERLAFLFDRPAPFPAGAGWDYSDTNYIVLGMIIERLAGRPYYDELRRRILEPLGLRNTIPSDRPDLPGVANGYAGPGNDLGGYDASLAGGRLAVNPQFEWTGGGIASTAEELARWGKLLFEERVVSGATFREALAGVPARLGPNVRYGLGVMIRETGLGPAWGHGGFFPGYATELLYFPDRRIAVAIQANRTNPYPRGLIQFLVRAAGIASGGGPAGAPPARGRYAIERVTVIPMTGERALADRTVLVRDGVIERIGPAGPVPDGVTRIDGRGKYLMPGLVDMHVHLMSDGHLPDSLAPDELLVMLANGITTARLMIGTPEQLALRAAVAEGRTLGPRLSVGSPQLTGRRFGDPFNGRVAATPEAARAAVRDVMEAGYDFLKLTFFISRPVYDAAVDEARRVGLRVVGHVDPQVGLDAALAAGQEIEHLDGMLEAVLADSAPTRQSVSGVQVWQPRAWESLDHVDDRKIGLVAAAAKRAGVWVTPTLFFLRMAFGEGEPDSALTARPDWALIPPAVRREMEGPRRQFWSNPPSPERRRRFLTTRARLAKALADAGVPLLAGTDAPEWFHTYGFMYHRELAALADAGLSPEQVLRAATVAPAEWLGLADRIGTVAEGKRADLVLLDADPLADVRNAARVAGVMADGRWLDRAALAARIAPIPGRMAAALP